MKSDHLVIIGAGPAGLGCAHELSCSGQSYVVVEREQVPGGLCRTLAFKGFLFDIGGHRFYTKHSTIEALWRKTMGCDGLWVRRLSRIFFRGQLVQYPLQPYNVYCSLGVMESVQCLLSFLWAGIFKHREEKSFERWVVNRFGQRLYSIFFKDYTHKVWGCLPQDLSSDVARHRIAGLSLALVLKKAFRGKLKRYSGSLYDHFFYPRRGPGEMFQRIADSLAMSGGQFMYGRSVVKIEHSGGKITAVGLGGISEVPYERLGVRCLYSSMPLGLLVQSLDPLPPREVLAASSRLNVRSFLVVNVILNVKDIFPDQWIYVQRSDVRLARIQNYKNWSKDMVSDQSLTSLGLEYFCNEGDDLWSMNDAELIPFALAELAKTGLVGADAFVDGFVVRCSGVYPVYGQGYRKDLDIVCDYMQTFSNLKLMGRHGQFLYCNSDQAFLSGREAAQGFPLVRDLSPDGIVGEYAD